MKHKSEFLFAIHGRLSSERMMLAYTLALQDLPMELREMWVLLPLLLIIEY